MIDAYSVSEAEKSAVRAYFKIGDDEVKTKVKMLREWVKGLPDLPPESQDEAFLNIMLLRAKFKDEYVKKNIENYFKVIAKYPEIFAKLGKFRLSKEVGIVIVSPKLTSTWERIAICKLSSKNLALKSFDIDQMILVTVTTGIIMFSNDYVASNRFLLDFNGITMRDLFKVNLRSLFKLRDITENMLRSRISGIELYNTPRIISILLNIARILLKPKMFLRVSVHNDLASLHKNIPKECLPCDYGGELSEDTEKLTEIWDHIIEKHELFFEKIANFSERRTEGEPDLQGLTSLAS